MSAVAAGLGFFAVLAVLSLLAGRHGRISPRVAAGAHLVGLLGWALVPAVWLTCLGSALGSWLGGIHTSGGGCLLGLDRSQWQLLGEVPGAFVAGALVVQGLRQAAAARRAEMRGIVLSRSVRRPTSAGVVWVVPSVHPAAFSSGLWRCRAVVTSGMLAPLGSAERQAVCEHEAAHVRLGHPRLLTIGGAIAAAYGRFPPVRRAWEGLRRELEAAADDEAARVVGTESVLSALIQAAVLVSHKTPPMAPGFMGAEHLRWRISRLEHPGSAEPWPTAVVAMAAAASASAMALVACVLAGAPASLAGVFACLVVVAAIGLRPTWAWGRHRGPGRASCTPAVPGTVAEVPPAG
ncbi:MAG: M56 family metallopeptidase [Actinomycetota bacterium]|nr:M56 family metallopeptidase [Actinomycetota bacterium]